MLENDAQKSAPRAVSEASQRQDETELLRGTRILVVDDTIDGRMIMRRFLLKAGAQVEVAEDGQIAIEKALQQSFDLILMDIRMPQMDGTEAASILRAQGATLPILAVTGNSREEQRREALHGAFDDYLVKPIDRHLLLATLVRYLKPRGTQDLS